MWGLKKYCTDDNNINSSENLTTNHPNLVTDLTIDLNAQEINVLSKGLQFSLSPGINQHTITGINIAFYPLANPIRWKHFRELNFQPSPIHSPYKPESKEELERKLQRIQHKLQVTLKELQPQRKWSDISHTDKKVINELQEKNYICLPSNKGTEFCVIQLDTYIQVALAHLSGSNTFQKVPPPPPHVGQNSRKQSHLNLGRHLHTDRVSPFCPAELRRRKHFVRRSFVAARASSSPFCPEELRRPKHQSLQVLPPYHDPQNRSSY